MHGLARQKTRFIRQNATAWMMHPHTAGADDRAPRAWVGINSSYIYEFAARSILSVHRCSLRFFFICLCGPTPSTRKMGFFTGLTSSALVSTTVGHQDHKNNTHDSAVEGHTTSDTPRDAEKLGTPRSGSSLSDTDSEELNKIDTTAEAGVQAVQAATHVWSKRDLIVAYVL